MFRSIVQAKTARPVWFQAAISTIFAQTRVCNANSVQMRAKQYLGGFTLSRFAHAAPTENGVREKVPITFLNHDGSRWTVEAEVGDTLLQVSEKHNIPLLGECHGGGLGSERFSMGPLCRSCHVFIDNAHIKDLNPMGEEEDSNLYWIQQRTANSRLACELFVTPQSKGMTVVIPSQVPLYQDFQ